MMAPYNKPIALDHKHHRNNIYNSCLFPGATQADHAITAHYSQDKWYLSKDAFSVPFYP